MHWGPTHGLDISLLWVARKSSAFVRYELPYCKAAGSVEPAAEKLNPHPATHCQHEQSQMTVIVGAGIILVRRTECKEQFLVLKGKTSGVWSFSKGHTEPEDNGSALRTAVRETYEETGLKAGVDYDILGNSIRFGKRPYWIGIVRGDPPISMSQGEHTDARWCTREEIAGLPSNMDVRDWITRSRGERFLHLMAHF
jgi:8-oxo-dGTP pyrophosphatase MutT (NUDIX family)